MVSFGSRQGRSQRVVFSGIIGFLICNCTEILADRLELRDRNGYEPSCRKNISSPCRPLRQEDNQTITCFGTVLPYSETSNVLVNANFTDHQIKTELERWGSGLRNLPRCWAVIQPLLCSYYMPRCQDQKVELSSQELCRIARTPCRVIAESLKEWPGFLKCDDPEKFASNCKNAEIQKLRFNTSARCNYPMIPVEGSFSHYDGFEGCALGCRDHTFSDEDHESVTKLIKYGGFACMIVTGIVIGTYIIGWRSSNTYPSVIVFYINCCYFIATAGWMVQFLPNAKEDIVCRKDSTIRRQEPNSGENVFCAVVFMFIYFGTMAALAWLVVFAYVFNVTCNTVGRMRERIDKQAVYFHFCCWLTPIVLTVVSLSLSAVEGNSLTGICFITAEPNLRICLIVVPVAIATVLILFMMWKGVYLLLKVAYTPSDLIAAKGKSIIRSHAMRVVLFTVGTTILIVTYLVFQTHELQMRPVWAQSKREFLICNLNLTTVAECVMEEKPKISTIMFNIGIFFAGGILVSIWAWTGASARTWKRFLTKRFKSENSLDQQGIGVPKHKLIAQAYEKRHQLSAKGQLSLDVHRMHEDPVGLNKLLDPNQLGQEVDDPELASQTVTNVDGNTDISSQWAAALPHLVTRRGGIIPPHSSNSVSCVSQDEPRRPSCDSAMSEITSRHLDHKGRKSRRSSFRGMFNNLSLGHHGNSMGGSRSQIGSSLSLESNPVPSIFPWIKALTSRRQGRLDDEASVPLNNVRLNPPLTKTTTVKEFAVQTSFERLPFVRGGDRGSGKNCNFGNNLMVDKSTQSSIPSVHEIGTQTKKSATKKKDKDNKDRSRREKSTEANACKTEKEFKEGNSSRDDQEDAVMKLLTPN